jgi:MFS family permease
LVADTDPADARQPTADSRHPLGHPAGGPLGRPFWWLWTSAGCSNLADGIFKIALPLIAVRYTQSPTVIAGLAFALTLPWLLFALPAGAIADRVDRRTAMLAANLVRSALLAALVLAIVLGFGSIVALYLAAFCIGIAETIYDTSAQSILPRLVQREQLSRANGRLNAAELTANQFIGPPLGGFLVAASAVAALLTPAALWIAAVGVLLLVRGRFRNRRLTRTSMRADIAEGLRFLWRVPVLRVLALLTGVFNFASNAMFAVFVLYAAGPSSAMGLTDPAYGLLLTTAAAGSLLGSFFADRIERRLGRSRSLVLTVIGTALIIGTPALTSNPIVIGAAFFVGGATIVVWNVVTVSLRQRITPDRLLGRVNSGYRLVAWGTMPLGAAVGGVLAQLVGLRATFAVLAVLTLIMLIVLRRLTDDAIDAAEHAADPAPT